MEALYYLELAINLQVDRVLFFCFFQHQLIGLDFRGYCLRIREVPKFQAKVSISMVLQKVFEALAVVGLDSCPISLIDDVFSYVRKVL